jgi:hypothetical protein
MHAAGPQRQQLCWPVMLVGSAALVMEESSKPHRPMELFVFSWQYTHCSRCWQSPYLVSYKPGEVTAVSSPMPAAGVKHNLLV